MKKIVARSACGVLLATIVFLGIGSEAHGSPTSGSSNPSGMLPSAEEAPIVSFGVEEPARISETSLDITHDANGRSIHDQTLNREDLGPVPNFLTRATTSGIAPAVSGETLEDTAVWKADLRLQSTMWGPRRLASTWLYTNYDGTGGNSDSYPTLACGPDGHLWLIWRSYRLGFSSLFHARFDGQHWSEPERIFSDNNYRNIPSLLTAGSKMFLAYLYKPDPSASYEIGLRVHNGSTWSAETRMTNDDSFDGYPCLGRTGDGRLWLFWMGYGGNYSDVYHRISTDGGTSWSAETALFGNASNSGFSLFPRSFVQDSGGKLWLFLSGWTADSEADSHVYVAASTDNGVSWSAPARLTSQNTGYEWAPSATVLPDNRLLVAFESNSGHQESQLHQMIWDAAQWGSEELAVPVDGANYAASTYTDPIDHRVWLMWAAMWRGIWGELAYQVSSDPGAPDVVLDPLALSVGQSNALEVSATITGLPLVGASVAISTPTGLLTGVTNAQGQAEFSLTPSDYGRSMRVEVSKAGLLPYRDYLWGVQSGYGVLRLRGSDASGGFASVQGTFHKQWYWQTGFANWMRDWLAPIGGETQMAYPTVGTGTSSEITGGTVKWHELRTGGDWVDLSAHFRDDQGLPTQQTAYVGAYLFTKIVSPTAKDVVLFVESRDVQRVYLNGTHLIDNGNIDGSQLSESRDVHLNAGENALLLKINGRSQNDGWRARVRFLQNGAPVTDLFVKPTPADQFALGADGWVSNWLVIGPFPGTKNRNDQIAWWYNWQPSSTVELPVPEGSYFASLIHPASPPFDSHYLLVDGLTVAANKITERQVTPAGATRVNLTMRQDGNAVSFDNVFPANLDWEPFPYWAMRGTDSAGSKTLWMTPGQYSLSAWRNGREGQSGLFYGIPTYQVAGDSVVSTFGMATENLATVALRTYDGQGQPTTGYRFLESEPPRWAGRVLVSTAGSSPLLFTPGGQLVHYAEYDVPYPSTGGDFRLGAWKPWGITGKSVGLAPGSSSTIAFGGPVTSSELSMSSTRFPQANGELCFGWVLIMQRGDWLVRLWELDQYGYEVRRIYPRIVITRSNGQKVAEFTKDNGNFDWWYCWQIPAGTPDDMYFLNATLDTGPYAGTLSGRSSFIVGHAPHQVYLPLALRNWPERGVLQPSSYFPLQVGNRWVYSWTNSKYSPSAITDTVFVTGQVSGDYILYTYNTDSEGSFHISPSSGYR